MSSNFSLITQDEPLATIRDRTVVPDKQGVLTRGTRASLMLMGVPDNQQFTGSSSYKRAIAGLTDTSGFGYQEFLLQNLQVGLQEKIQVNQNFGDGEVVFLFGQSPIFVNLSGVLIDDVDNQWFLSFMEAYQNSLRGSKLAQSKYLVKLITSSQTFVGILTALDYSQDSSRKVDVPFHLQFLAKTLKFNSVGEDLEPSKKEILTQRTVKNLKDLFHPVTPAPYVPTAMISNGTSIPPSPYTTTVTGNQGGVLSVGSWYSNETQPTGAVVNTGAHTSSFLTETYSRVNSYLSTLSTNLSNISGEANMLVTKGLSPINQTIGEVRSVANQAGGMVRQVVNGLQGIRNQAESVKAFFDNTEQLLKDTAGYITFAPSSLKQNARAMISAGKLNASQVSSDKAGADILINSPGFTAEDGAIL